MATRPKKPAVLKPIGSSLADFLPLLPAEKALLACVRNGTQCILNSGKRPDENLSAQARKNITIRSGFLRFLAIGGDAQAPVHASGLNLQGAWIECKDSYGRPDLDLGGCQLPQSLGILNSVIDGHVTLVGARIRLISLQGSAILQKDELGCSLLGDRLEATGGVFLHTGFKAAGTVRLWGAKIGGILDCGGGTFEATDVSLNCESLETIGGVFLNAGFRAAGTVRLTGAKISGGFGCNGGTFEGTDVSLNCDRLEATSGIFLSDGFKAAGTVRLLCAKISSDFSCSGGTFEGREVSLHCDDLETTGSIHLRNGFRAAGTVRLTGAKVGGGLDCSGAAFNREGVALDCQAATIVGAFFYRAIESAGGGIELTRADIGVIADDEDSWRKSGSVNLDGCRYDAFVGDLTGRDFDWWKEWLDKQPDKDKTTDFKPQPYEQLAKVLRAMGHETTARKLLLLKHCQLRDAARRHPQLYGAPIEKYGWPWFKWRWLRLMNWCLETFVGYGYRPGLAVGYLFLATLFMAPIYWASASRGVITPTDPLVYLSQTIPPHCRENWVMYTSPGGKCAAQMPSEHAPFNALVYALDISLPVIDLGQEKAWAPRSTFPSGANDPEGWVVRIFLYAHTLTGWILSLLFASAVSGIIRKD